MNFSKTMSSIGRALNKSLPSILTGVTVIGICTTAILAAEETPKAIEIYNHRNYENNKQTLVKVAKAYMPAIISGAATIACAIASNRINTNRIKSLTTAYISLDTNFRNYKAATLALVGAETEKKIQEAAIEKDMDKPVVPEQQFIFYDRYSRRSIVSTCEDVITAEYELNRLFILRGYATLNDFYKYLGLEDWESGDLLGWSFDEGLNYGYEWVDFSNVKHTDKVGTVWYSIEMIFEPTIEGCYY
jgi:hypothetical protein